MRATVIIPCYRRPDWLRKTLQSVLVQAGDEIKIVTVYQDEQDDLSLREWCESRKITYLFSDQPSTPKSRNLGLAQAVGEVVIFFDDDVELFPNCITNHLNNYTDPVVAGVGGRVITVRETGEDQVKEGVDVIGNVNRIGQVIGDQNYNSLTRRETKTTPLGCNMSFRLSELRAVGGFDETYIGNAMREETDPVLRLLRAGRKIVFDPTASVRHFLAKTGGSRSKPRDQWYRDFFFNSAYFYYKFTHQPYRTFAFLSLWPYLAKYLYRYGRSWQSFWAPITEIRRARKMWRMQ